MAPGVRLLTEVGWLRLYHFMSFLVDIRLLWPCHASYEECRYQHHVYHFIRRLWGPDAMPQAGRFDKGDDSYAVSLQGWPWLRG